MTFWRKKKEIIIEFPPTPTTTTTKLIPITLTPLTKHETERRGSITFQDQFRRGSILSLGEINCQISSKSAKELWPTILDSFSLAYSNNQLDFLDLPTPNFPLRTVLYAAKPTNELWRQRSINQMQILVPQLENPTRSSSTASESSISSSSSFNSTFSTTLSTRTFFKIKTFNQFQFQMNLIFKIKRILDELFERFGGTVNILIIDDDDLIELGHIGSGFLPVERRASLDSHALLQSNTIPAIPFVVPDTAKDWRFKSTHFIEDFKPIRFYASFPIYSPAPFSDLTLTDYIFGFITISDNIPRSPLKEAEQTYLKKSAQKVDELLFELDLENSKKEEEIRFDENIEFKKKSKDGSNFNSIIISNIISSCTSFPPVFLRQSNERPGVLATIPSLPNSPNFIQKSLKFILESLEMDLIYVLSVSLPFADGYDENNYESTNSMKLVNLISSNSYQQSFRFDLQLHLDLFSKFTSNLFVNPKLELDQEDLKNSFQTGFIIALGINNIGRGFILGCLSKNVKKVISKADWSFIRSFRQDFKLIFDCD